jgi:sugar O-acyltransferase (sialic acid O-acetyltransferase NeuD family)
MDELIGVYGASGFGREVMPLVKSQISHRENAGSFELVFIDDNDNGTLLNSHRVVSFQDFCDTSARTKSVSIAIASSKVRERLFNKCAENSIGLFTTFGPNALVLEENIIGSGSIFCPFSMVTSNTIIGKCFHANIYSYVAHDCVIGDFVTFAPGVKCNGNVVIEDHAYVGTGAIIKQGTPGEPLVIGRNAVVGMGAVVTKSVSAGVTVVGNPARLMEK